MTTVTESFSSGSCGQVIICDLLTSFPEFTIIIITILNLFLAVLGLCGFLNLFLIEG